MEWLSAAANPMMHSNPRRGATISSFQFHQLMYFTKYIYIYSFRIPFKTISHGQSLGLCAFNYFARSSRPFADWLWLISITKLLFELWRAFNTFGEKLVQAISPKRYQAGLPAAYGRVGLPDRANCRYLRKLFARVCILIKWPTQLSTLSAFGHSFLFITKTFLFMSHFL